MSVSVSRGSIGNFETIILTNSFLRAVIIPELGGRVWEIEDLNRGRQWIWHRNDVPLQASSKGAVYDDVWAGGWEELFPNDASCTFEGRDLPDHGEWWTMRWNVVDISSEPAAKLRLSADTSVVRTTCTKEFRLAPEDATLSVDYRIQSHEQHPFHFLFKQHLAIGVTQDCRLSLPGGRVQKVDPAFGTLLPAGGPFSWPYAGEGDEVIDLQAIPPRSRSEREFVYVQNLPQPWCSVQDLRRKASIRMDFDSRVLPYVWLFLTYGGWRNLYTAVLEPCSNLPKDLSEAVRLGQSAHLEPGQEFFTSVSVTLDGFEDK